VIAGLLLAAGGSRRFGSQKLVAALNDVPLVRYAAQALAQVTDELIVVVGSDASAVTRALDGIAARIIENSDWSQGLSTSIRSGVQAAASNTTALLIALGDEPRVSGNVSRSVISAWRETGRPIVVARYAGESGHPVLFDASVFAELTALDGDRGAKRVIDRIPERVAYVDIATAPPLDVDEPADLRRLGDPQAHEIGRSSSTGG
jgi:molybdenum cofactor cytidylyltransferase